MPISFIRPKAPKWIPIVHNRTPFSSGRVENPAGSPHPYASPDIIDIHDTTATPTSFDSVAEPTLQTKSSVSTVTPNLKIELDLSSDPFDEDWFQTRFTLPSSPRHLSACPQRAEGSRVAASEARGVSPARRWETPRSVPAEVQTDNDDDDIDLSTSEDDVLDHLKAMDVSIDINSSASTFLNLPPQSTFPPRSTEMNKNYSYSSPARRHPPTPIRIPSLTMHGPQVQVVRSAEANNSRPLSEISSAESSAVSGQTLARALLGNSFGDHPLMNSPCWRDRTLSGTSDTFAADLNAPPIPPNADKVYVPPQTPRHSGVETKRKTNFRRRSSTGSLASPVSRGDSNNSRSRPNSVTEFAQEIERDIQALRRISRISEAPSSPSTTPANPDIPIEPGSQFSPSELSPVQVNHPTPPPKAPTPPPAVVSSDPMSPTPSSSTLVPSTKELENVLDYYSSSEKADKGFTPSFSPIIEESSSQLSSPASKRLSVLATPKSRAMSPLSGTTHDLSTVRRPSDGAVVSRTSSARRRSIQVVNPTSPSPTPPQSSQNTNANTQGGSTSGQRSSLVPPRPLGTVVGGRLRSGSAPSPIKITRDSRDLNTYKIISPLPENALQTPSTGDSSEAMATQQTFPETPNIFSPFLSPSGSVGSPGMVQWLPEGHEVSPFPQTPMSAALPTQGRSQHPSLSQQVLLTRAASMANHTRQSSVSRRAAARGPSQTSIEEDETGDTGAESAAQVVDVSSIRPSEVSPTSSSSQYSEPSNEQHPPYEESPAFASAEAVASTRTDSPSTIGSSPRLAYLSRDNSSRSTYSSPSVTTSPQAHPSQSHFLGSVPEFTDPFDSQSRASPHLNQRTPVISPHTHSLPTPPPPVVITPPAGESPSPYPYLGRSLRRISEISHTSFESPPPYETIDQDQPPPISVAAITESNAESHYATQNVQPSPPATHDSSSEHLPLTRKTSSGGNRDRRGRMRPTGPRRPLSHINNLGTPTTRARNASDASVASISPNSTPTPPTLVNSTAFPSPKSPNFTIPVNPYRGLTMDQAKWTFTSTQLQTIVSRAIRQSAEASSIRLLRLDILDNEIPHELERLTNQKMEIKGKYKSLTRSSEALYSKLSSQIATGSTSAQTTLEELRDVTRQLNKLTEDLHSVDQQHAQIQQLVQIHSASALSMALRKLNASFLKQLAQTQELQRQIRELEDEIWTINQLRSSNLSAENQPHRSQSGGPQTSPSHDASTNSNSASSPTARASDLERKRSAITRKPSLRYSRSIGLSGNRLSQRSSLSSSGGRSSMTLGDRTSGTNSSFNIPPVPPLPRRRPTDIVTDAPTTRSTTMISTDGGTPNTELRAMIRAQDELYQMLGMSLRGDRRLRRSHSIIGLPGNPEAQPHPSTMSTSFLQPAAPIPRTSRTPKTDSFDSGVQSNRASRNVSRPQSYPASLLDAYNPLDADRHAMLATLEMISQDEH
ncbi:hypothetical protein AN958_05321 [Leucoagaricus sp. SymC.cos]|nr:hypothetical protein AN958_05321 [Leucoagaricus sp. SymC.cos]